MITQSVSLRLLFIRTPSCTCRVRGSLKNLNGSKLYSCFSPSWMVSSCLTRGFAPLLSGSLEISWNKGSTSTSLQTTQKLSLQILSFIMALYNESATFAYHCVFNRLLFTTHTFRWNIAKRRVIALSKSVPKHSLIKAEAHFRSLPLRSLSLAAFFLSLWASCLADLTLFSSGISWVCEITSNSASLVTSLTQIFTFFEMYSIA